MGSWRTDARLAGLNPHSTFAFSPNYPKQPNPLLASPHLEPIATATGGTTQFSRTIPLSELMQADVDVSKRSSPQPSRLHTSQHPRRSASPTLQRAQTAQHASTSSSSPNLAASSGSFRIPYADRYSVALAAVHSERADRLIRQPKGWSQGGKIAKLERQREEQNERIHIYQPGIHEELVHPRVHSSSSPSKRSTFIPSSDDTSSVLSHIHPSSLASLGSVASTAIAAALNPRQRAAEKVEMSQKKLNDFWKQVENEKKQMQMKLQQRIARNQAKEERQFQTLMEKLNDNQDLLQEIDEYLTLHSADSAHRKETLYQSWCQQVYGPIQSMIQTGLAQRSVSEIEARHRKQFESFLKISNKKKHGLHNDVILEDDYNPLESRKDVLRISVGHLHDPLKSQFEQDREEWKLYQQFYPEAERIHHQTKTILSPTMWGTGKIEATPHGRYSLLHGNTQKPVGKKLVEPSASYTSAFSAKNSFDHYQIDTDPETVKSQFFRKGKRVEGYEGAADKADYNIVNNVEPSFKLQYSNTKPSHPRASTAFSFPTQSVPLTQFGNTSSSSSTLPAIGQSPHKAQRFVVESKEQED